MKPGTAVLLALIVAGCSSSGARAPLTPDPYGGGLPSLPSDQLTMDEAAGRALLEEYAKRYAQGYPLMAGDKIQVVVVGHSELSFTTLVPVEGWIDFPTIGKVTVAGKTFGEVRADIARRLGDGYLVNPDVTVLVNDYAKRNIYLSGAVVKPSDYALASGRPMTLLQLVSQAGGFRDDAETRGVLVFRPKQAGSTERVVIAVDVVAVTKAGKGQDPLLLPEDVVFVPVRERVYVLGQVVRAGGFTIPGDQPSTITKVISMAGGFTRIAKDSAVRLNRRLKNGERATYTIDVGRILDGHPEEDVPLQPGDVIFVPESFF